MGSRKAWRTAVAAVAAFLLLVLTPGPARAEETDPDLLEELLEKHPEYREGLEDCLG